MAHIKTAPSRRAAARAAQRERRVARAVRREAVFDMAASGYSIEAIAAQFSMTVKTARREMERAVASRRLDAPDHFLSLQVARLSKALRAAEAAVDRNDLRGVAPMIRIVAALERCHQPPAPAPAALPALERADEKPLALTHATAREN